MNVCEMCGLSAATTIPGLVYIDYEYMSNT